MRGDEMEVHLIPILQDNYVYLLHDPNSKETICIDPGTSKEVLDFLTLNHWKLKEIWNTHHHSDHIGGNLELQKITGCEIVGFSGDEGRIPGLGRKVKEGDVLSVGEYLFQVIEVPGHTLGHIAYYASSEHLLFPGDTLFAMGCGRLFEGTSEQMWGSLKKLKELPDETQVYCTHEYTLSNTRFALSVEPHNEELKERMRWVQSQRAKDLPTLPSRISLEKKTNPFLRVEGEMHPEDSTRFKAASPGELFKKLRLLKDSF